MRPWLPAQAEEQDSSLPSCLKQVENCTNIQRLADRGVGGGKEQPGPSREAPADGRWGGQGGQNLRGCGAAPPALTLSCTFEKVNRLSLKEEKHS